MFTRQAPAIGNNLLQGGMAQQQAAAVQSLVGQCRQPLVHRGPVTFDYTRQNMRLILPVAGMPWPPVLPGIGPPPQTFPASESPSLAGDSAQPAQEPLPPEDPNGHPPGGVSSFDPPDSNVDPPPPPQIFGRDTWVVGDRRFVDVQPEFFPLVTTYRVSLIAVAEREFVTDVFVDDGKLIIEKRKYLVSTVGEKDPTATEIAKLASIERVKDVYAEPNSIMKVKVTQEVFVPIDQENPSDDTSQVIGIQDCP